MAKRPKHYDRPGKRPGPPRVRANGTGGSIADQRASRIEQCSCIDHPRYGVEIDHACPLHGDDE